MLGQIVLASGLAATITFVLWYFAPPKITPVSEECRKHWARTAMREGDDPNDPNRMTL